MVNTGDKEQPRTRVQDVPGSCDGCIADKLWHGCGWDEDTRGRGAIRLEGGDILETCPQYHLRQPFVASVYELLEDYKRGALGNVLDLEASAIDALKVLSAAMTDWEVAQQEALHGG